MSEKIGLVLSGGGAKGAYEIGVYKALEEMGVLPYIDAIAGTSVGALNAALLESRGAEYAQEIWNGLKLSDLLNPDTERIPTLDMNAGDNYNSPTGLTSNLFSNPFSNLLDMPLFDESPENDFDNMMASDTLFPGSAVRTSLTGGTTNYTDSFGGILPCSSVTNSFNPVDMAFSNGVNLLNKLRNSTDIMKFIREGLPFNLDKIAELIDNHVDFSRIHRKIYAMCTDIIATPMCFMLNKYFPPTQKKIILASATIPVVYTGIDGVEINGINYFDGGVAGDASNTPVSCLYDSGYRNIIAVHLKRDYDMSNQYNMNDANIINIFPSRSLGTFFTGTLNLNSVKVQNDIELGYRDAAQYRDKIADMVYNL